MILEKELEITTDPRAVYLNGDAVRILWDLGLRKQLADLGHGIGDHQSFLIALELIYQM